MILTEETDDVFTIQDENKSMHLVLDLNLTELIDLYNQIQEKLKVKGVLAP